MLIIAKAIDNYFEVAIVTEIDSHSEEYKINICKWYSKALSESILNIEISSTVKYSVLCIVMQSKNRKCSNTWLG